MGLESKVNNVLQEVAPHLGGAYRWDRGKLYVDTEKIAEEISATLDFDGNFGPTWVEPDGDEAIVEFGPYVGD